MAQSRTIQEGLAISSSKQYFLNMMIRLLESVSLEDWVSSPARTPRDRVSKVT